MKVISNDDKYIASTWGAAIHLKAGEPKEVSHELGLLCLQEGCSEFKGEMPTTPVVEETPVIDEDSGGAAEEVPVEEESVVVEVVTPDLHGMTKIELEQYGRTIGIELDRRKKKADLIEELKAV
tara:strand:+ start:1347 stop:1718 length:372 start_codon:yes stop_codon:yes gene_type:complete